MTAVNAETLRPSSLCGRGIGSSRHCQAKTARQISPDVPDQSKPFQNGEAEQKNRQGKKIKGEHTLKTEVSDQYEMTEAAVWSSPVH